MKKVLDVRTLECPKPILETQKALKDTAITTLEVIVGNKTSRENLKRFSETSGYPYEIADEGDDTYRFTLEIKPSEGREEEQAEKQEDSAQVSSEDIERTYLVLSDELGKGDSELGKILMKGFLYTMTQTEPLPKKILLLNSAVKLSTINSETVEHLQALEANGVEIFSCGTCLNFYDLADDLKVGLIGNMYDVVEGLNKSKNVVTIGS